MRSSKAFNPVDSALAGQDMMCDSCLVSTWYAYRKFLTCMPMASGLARLGAAMPLKDAVLGTAPEAADLPMAPEAAQPAKSELTDMAPSGNRGALARTLMA